MVVPHVFSEFGAMVVSGFSMIFPDPAMSGVVHRRGGTHCALRRLRDGDPGGWRHSGWLGARVQDQGPAPLTMGTWWVNHRKMRVELVMVYSAGN